MMCKYYDQARTIQYYWNTKEWLGRRMLFLSGPRQVGKTTFVTQNLCTQKEAYFNWDHRKTRKLYQEDSDFFVNIKSDWICFDEIHKRPKWKDILKGIYDVHKDQFKFVITGSARLETFKRSGDSLVGRYFHTHLFPLNIPDFCKNDFVIPENLVDFIELAADLTDHKVMNDLLNYGGFPEPFFRSSDEFWNRWNLQHSDLILTEDIRDLTKIIDIDKVESLLEFLKPSVGNLTSYRSLAEDLETTHGSIKRWLETLERVHLVFSIPPYSTNIKRSYKKEKKWYFTDWKAAHTNVFENYIAASLLRATTLYQDRYGQKFSLHFVRTHDGTEVDFLICKNNKPWLLIEAKEGKPEISSAIHRFTNELKVPCFVVTKKHGWFRKHPSRFFPIYSISWSKLGQLFP